MPASLPKWFAPEPDAAAAQQVPGGELHALICCLPKWANILWKKQRRGELAAEVPEIAARMLLNVGVQASACAELMPEATALAARPITPPTIASIWRWRCVTAWSW